MKIAFDFCGDARSIAQDMESEGHVSEAQVLRDDIDTASVSTQMLMALRHHMSLDLSIAGLSGALQARMRAFISGASAILD